MEWISGNIFIRPNELPKAGDKTEGHVHNFDHTTIVWKGKVNVKAWSSKRVETPDGHTEAVKDKMIAEKEFEQGSHLLIRADVIHEITALEDNTVFWCVYAHRTPQGKLTQVNDGWYGAYM